MNWLKPLSSMASLSLHLHQRTLEYRNYITIWMFTETFTVDFLHWQVKNSKYICLISNQNVCLVLKHMTWKSLFHLFQANLHLQKLKICFFLSSLADFCAFSALILSFKTLSGNETSTRNNTDRLGKILSSCSVAPSHQGEESNATSQLSGTVGCFLTVQTVV